MNGNLPIGDTFGNYLVHGISEIKAPPPIPWSFEAPGWTVVWMLLLLILTGILFRAFRKWRANAYRRTALAAMRKVENHKGDRKETVLSALPRILKDTALCAYPRTHVASLSGEKWIEFLQQSYGTKGFDRVAAENLNIIAYQRPEHWWFSENEAAQTIYLAKNWIRYHDRGVRNA